VVGAAEIRTLDVVVEFLGAEDTAAGLVADGAALNLDCWEGGAAAVLTAGDALTGGLLDCAGVGAKPPPRPKKSTAGSSGCAASSSSSPSCSSSSSFSCSSAFCDTVLTTSDTGAAVAFPLPLRTCGSREVAEPEPEPDPDPLVVDDEPALDAGSLKPPPSAGDGLFDGSGSRPASPPSFGLFAAGCSSSAVPAVSLPFASPADRDGLGRSRTNFFGPEAAALVFVFGGGRLERKEEVEGLLVDAAAVAVLEDAG